MEHAAYEKGDATSFDSLNCDNMCEEVIPLLKRAETPAPNDYKAIGTSAEEIEQYGWRTGVIL